MEGVKDGAGDVEVPQMRGGAWTEHGVLSDLWHEVLAADACCASCPSAACDDPMLGLKDASTDQFAFTGSELACHALE